MAEECGLGIAYHNAYRQFSSSTHATVDDLSNYFDMDQLAFGVNFEHQDIPLVMVESIRSYWSLSLLVSDAFDIDLRGSLKCVYDKLKRIEKTLAND